MVDATNERFADPRSEPDWSREQRLMEKEERERRENDPDYTPAFSEA